MGCECDSDQRPSFFNEKLVTARRPHTCCECKGEIRVGDRYQQVSGKWDGDFATYTTCEPCADLREALESVCCPLFGRLIEHYVEYLTENSPLAEDVVTGKWIFPENHLIDRNGNRRNFA